MSSKAENLLFRTLELIYTPKHRALVALSSIKINTRKQPSIQRSHLPKGDEIRINLDALFKYEHFISVCNIVAKCRWLPFPTLSCLAHYAPNLEFVSSNTSAISIRVDKVMCRMFTTGVVVFTAGRTIEQTRYEAHQYRLFMCSIAVPLLIFDRSNPNHRPYFELHTLEPLSEFWEFKVVNIVARAIANTRTLDLMKIVSQCEPPLIEGKWDPGKFPGAKVCFKPSSRFPFESKQVSTHLFDSGKNMIMGTNLDDMKMSQQYICKWVVDLVDENVPQNPRNRFAYRILRQAMYHLQEQPPGGLDSLSAIDKNPILNMINEATTHTGDTIIPRVVGFNTIAPLPEQAFFPIFGPEDDDDMQVVEDDYIDDYLNKIIVEGMQSGHMIRRR